MSTLRPPRMDSAFSEVYIELSPEELASRIQKLKGNCDQRHRFFDALNIWWESDHGEPVYEHELLYSEVGGRQIDIYRLSCEVDMMGGIKVVSNSLS